MRLAVLLAAVAVAAVLAMPATAQPLTFGSADDPAEAAPRTARPNTLAAFAGPSYIGVRWRVGVGVFAEGTAGPLRVALDGRLRGGTSGIYDQDVDELYDVLRLVRYARLEPTAQRPLYVRLGPLQRVTLGTGLLVRELGSVAAWDERTVGVEAALDVGGVRLEAFSTDVRPDGLVGGRIELRPGYRPGMTGLRSLALGLQAVHHLDLDGERDLTAFAADARFDLRALGDLRLQPFAAVARYEAFGQGGALGVALDAPELADLGRFRLALGATVSGDGFIPGYLNAFHPVNHPGARIVDSDLYFRDRPAAGPVGTALADASGGVALFAELRAVVFGTLELRQFVRRDFAGSTGVFGLGATLVPGDGQTLRFIFDIQRQGLDGLTDVFSDATDEIVMAFHLDYNLPGPAWLFLRSRYGYRALGTLEDGTERFLVERRFEPFVGVRF